MKNKILSFIKENTWLPGMKHGWGNGYVVIFKGHPMYGKHYDEVPVDVHGGLTFSESVNSLIGDFPELTEEMKDGWVFGFDTAHYNDSMERWPKEAVERETENLKSQFVELSPDFPVRPFEFS
jgi:hypothetical protein